MQQQSREINFWLDNPRVTTPDQPGSKKRPPRFLLAMPDDLRTLIEREAEVNNRPVTAEINMRLRASFRHGTLGVEEGKVVYAPPPSSQGFAAQAGSGGLSEVDAAMLAVFRGLPPEKQLALLSLFR